MKFKAEHFWLLLFAVNFAAFQLVQDHLRPSYTGDHPAARYFLGVAPNFFPAVGIPALFMVLLPQLFPGRHSWWILRKKHLAANLISVTGLVGWEFMQLTGKLVFDWNDVLWTLLGALVFQVIWWRRN